MTKRLRHSLFFRIFLFFALGAGLALLVAALAGRILYTDGERPRTLGQKYVVGVQAFLMKEIPALATPEAWREFLGRHPELEVAVWKGGALAFSSLSVPIELERFAGPHVLQDGGTRLVKDGHRVYAMGTEGDLAVVFCQDLHPARGTIAKTFLVLILMLGTVFWTIHRFVARQLAPIRQLQEGTHEIAQGNFRFRLGDLSAAEFADLVGSFNSMAEKLETTFVNNTLMIGNLSHDLKAYLTRLRMTTEVQVTDAEARKSLCEDIGALTRFVDRTLEAFRANTDQATFRFETVDLDELVQEATAQVSTLNPGKTVELGAVGPGMRVSLDRHFMRILLVNLLDNAIAYGDEITVSLSAADGAFTLAIDNRCLVPVNEAERPFLSQPFFRPEKSRRLEGGHSGLGLYIARMIAEAHHFSFSIATADGRFRVEIRGAVGTAIAAVPAR